MGKKINSSPKLQQIKDIEAGIIEAEGPLHLESLKDEARDMLKEIEDRKLTDLREWRRSDVIYEGYRKEDYLWAQKNSWEFYGCKIYYCDDSKN